MPARAMWGVFVRKERWALSWRGRLILVSAALLLGALAVKGVYPFLAITDRVNANILVVEGWIHEYAIQAAVKEFRSNHYQRVFTTGGPVGGSGGYINDFYTTASVGADLLKKSGPPGRTPPDGSFPCDGPRPNVWIGRRTAELASRPQYGRVQHRCCYRRSTRAPHSPAFSKSVRKGRTNWDHRRAERGLSRESMVAIQPGP